MSVKKQVGIVVGVYALVGLLIPFVYGMARLAFGSGIESARDDTVFVLCGMLSFAWLILGAIYLTIGAAIRHNSRREQQD